MPEPSYVKQAFAMKPNLIFLAGGVAAAVILPPTGLVLGAVAALEVAYLATMSSNPRFRRAVRSRPR